MCVWCVFSLCCPVYQSVVYSVCCCALSDKINFPVNLYWDNKYFDSDSVFQSGGRAEPTVLFAAGRLVRRVGKHQPSRPGRSRSRLWHELAHGHVLQRVQLQQQQQQQQCPLGLALCRWQQGVARQIPYADVAAITYHRCCTSLHRHVFSFSHEQLELLATWCRPATPHACSFLRAGWTAQFG